MATTRPREFPDQGSVPASPLGTTYSFSSHIRSKRILLSALLLASVACDTSTTSADGSSGRPAAAGKADGALDDDAGVVTIAQAGAFRDTEETRFPVAVHYGFTRDHARGWSAAGEVEVEYDDNGDSLPVRVRVPEDVDAALLAFVIRFETDAWGGQWSADQFIALDNPEGSMVRLPVYNGAGYPFAQECYEITVDGTRYPGMVDDVLFGFTDSSREAYDANNDVPWFDVFDNPHHEGVLSAVRAHDGGDYGSMRMLAEWIRVPAEYNLVYKLGISKYEGICGIDGDTNFEGEALTQTYFVDVE